MNFDDILDVSTPTPTLSPQEKNRKKNYVVVALDESGSMSTMRKEAIELFNAQVVEARNASEMDNHMSLITFSDDVSVEMWDVNAEEVDLLDEQSYVPDGFTAMLDAVGLGISKLLQQPDISNENVSVLFIIISDGFENASKEYTYSTIAKMVKEVLETKRWSFVYLGASNLDLQNVKSMGVSPSNTMAFAACSAGLANASYNTRVASRSFYNSRLQGETYTSSFYNDNTTEDNKSKDEANS